MYITTILKDEVLQTKSLVYYRDFKTGRLSEPTEEENARGMHLV